MQVNSGTDYVSESATFVACKVELAREASWVSANRSLYGKILAAVILNSVVTLITRAQVRPVFMRFPAIALVAFVYPSGEVILIG